MEERLLKEGERFQQVSGYPWCDIVKIGTIIEVMSKENFITFFPELGSSSSPLAVHLSVVDPGARAQGALWHGPNMECFWREFICQRHFVFM